MSTFVQCYKQNNNELCNIKKKLQNKIKNIGYFYLAETMSFSDIEDLREINEVVNILVFSKMAAAG